MNKSQKDGSTQPAISSILSPKKYGYDFLGYYTSTNGYGKKFANGVTKMINPNGNHNVDIAATTTMFDDNTKNIVYADYTPRTPTVTFDKRGGKYGSDSTVGTYGKDMPITDTSKSALTAPVRDGWTFKGYYSEPDGKGKKYYNEAMGSCQQCDQENNFTLYAYWVDETPPDVYIIPSATGWTNDANGITLTIVMQDRGSGLKGTKCSVKMDGNVIDPGNCVVKGGGTVKKDSLNGETRSCTFTVECKTEGVHRYEAVATDVAGNQNAASSAVYYDITAPTGHVDVTGPGIDSGANLNSLNSGTGWTFKDGRVTDYH